MEVLSQNPNNYQPIYRSNLISQNHHHQHHDSYNNNNNNNINLNSNNNNNFYNNQNNNIIKSSPKKPLNSSNSNNSFYDNQFDDMYSSPTIMGSGSNNSPTIKKSPSLTLNSLSNAASTSTTPTTPTWKACCVNTRCMLCVNGTPRCLCMNHPSWTLILRVVFFSLSQLYPDKEYFNLKKEVYVYLNDHWEILSPNQKQSHNWRRQVQDALSHSRFFRSGRHTLRCNGYWQLKLQCNPWKYVNSKQFEALKIDEPGSPQDDFINYFPYNLPGDKQVHLQPRTSSSLSNSPSPTPIINSSQTTPTTSPSEIAWIMSSPKSLSLTNLKPQQQQQQPQSHQEYNDLSSPSSNYHSDDMPSSPLSNSSPSISYNSINSGGGSGPLNTSQDSSNFNFSALTTLSNFSLSQQPVSIQLPNLLKISNNNHNIEENGKNNNDKINQMKSILNCTL